MKKVLTIGVRFVGIIIFGIILYKTDWKEFVRIYSEVDFIEIIPIYLLLIPSYLIIVYRWHYLLSKVSIKRTYFANVTLLFSGVLMGMITPGRIGELYPLVKLHREGHSKVKGAFTIILPRLFDVSFLLIISVFSIYLVATLKDVESRVIKLVLGVVLGFLCLAVAAFFRHREYVAEKSVLLMKKIFNLEFNKGNMLKYMEKLNINLFVNLGLLTAVFWTLYFFQLYLFGCLLDFNISFIKLYLIFALVFLAAALPISFSGIGTREFAMINLLSIVGITREKALALSLMIYSFMLINLFVASVLWGLEHRTD